jgi:hypothetical protein
MKLTGKRLLMGAGALVAALVAYLLFLRGSGGLALKVQVSGTADATASGRFRAAGTGAGGGAFGTVTLTAAGSTQLEANCVVVSGSGQLATAAGTLQLRPAGSGRTCFSQKGLEQLGGGGELQASAKLDATGTSGSLLGRHGRLKASGTVSTDNGAFTVTFSGRLRR